MNFRFLHLMKIKNAFLRNHWAVFKQILFETWYVASRTTAHHSFFQVMTLEFGGGGLLQKFYDGGVRDKPCRHSLFTYSPSPKTIPIHIIGIKHDILV